MTQDHLGSNRGGTATPGRGSNVLSIVAFVLSAVAVLFLPIFFGPAAIIAAVVALVRKERLAKIAIIVAIVATVVGFVLGAIVQNAMA
jgi:hypothetical protein